MSVPPGVVCSPEEYSRSLTDPAIYCLSRQDSIGLTVTTEAGFISLFAVLGVFTLIVRNGIRHVHSTGKWLLVQAPMDVLMLSLFVADLIQALGAVMDIRWVHDGKVVDGAFCTAQGVVQQLGETSVALTTLLITLFTFWGIWFRKGLGATSHAIILIAVAWIFVILFVGISNATHKHTLESPTPYWCWISERYLGLRIAGEYVWLWITLGVSTFAYALLFLWARGNLTVSEDSWWRFTLHRSPSSSCSPDTDRALRREAYAMIAYPVCYSILILPLSVVRWIGFTQGNGAVPSAATFAVISVYGLSGAVNVALLLNTRPNSLLFGNVAGASAGAQGRAPSPIGTVASAFEARSRSQNSSSFQLGHLPSASDSAAWDIPPPQTKGIKSRHDDREEDDSTVHSTSS